MKVAILNDTHFGVRNDSIHFINNQKKFYSDVFFPTLKREGIGTLFHLGDFFDKRSHINYSTLYEAKKFFFNPARDMGINIIGIAGNHDVYYKNTNEVNALDLILGEYSNVKVFTQYPYEFSIGKTSILLVPWINKENLNKCYNVLDKSSANIVMGHFELSGFEMRRGELCKHGMKTETLNKFDSVLSGHFHHPSKKGNIEYLGAPYEMDWSDSEGRRGFNILETKTGNITFVDNPHKMFHKIIYNDTDWTLDMMKDFEFDDMTGTYVKILVEKKDDPYMFDIFINKLEDSGTADVKIIENGLDVEASSNDEGIDVKDTRDILLDYVSDLKIDDVHRNKVKDYTVDIYRKAVASE